MSSDATPAERLAQAVRRALGRDLPLRLRTWDGSEAGAPSAPVLVVRSPRAIRRLLWAPGELGLARAHIAGEVDLDGDLLSALAALARVADAPPPAGRPGAALGRRLRALGTAAALAGVGPPPPPPAEEFRRRSGRRHTRARDAAAVAHHYDVGNEFFALVLGRSMVYSCAVWDSPSTGLDAAQEAKLDLVCRKLGLVPGMRLLDVGCGWGALARHAAGRYGATVVGVTLSAEQVALARRAVADDGLADRVEIRLQDYRDVPDGPFDAVSSIGMAEHVGRNRMAGYVATLHGLLAPGGRLLNHAISCARPGSRRTRDPFIDRAVFPDGELKTLAQTVHALQAGGLEVLDVEALRPHYALTLRAWLANLEEHWDAAVAAAGEGRARVWRLYMAASALAFERGDLGVDQVLARRPGGAPPPLRLCRWPAPVVDGPGGAPPSTSGGEA